MRKTVLQDEQGKIDLIVDEKGLAWIEFYNKNKLTYMIGAGILSKIVNYIKKEIGENYFD